MKISFQTNGYISNSHKATKGKRSMNGLDILGPSAPEEVKKAWEKAENESCTNGMAKAPDGKLTQITELFAMSLVNVHNGGTRDVLGSTVESAKIAVQTALKNLGIPKNAEERKEKTFYEAFLRYLN